MAVADSFPFPSLNRRMPKHNLREAITIFFQYQIPGCHLGEDVYVSLLSCNAVWTCSQIPYSALNMNAACSYIQRYTPKQPKRSTSTSWNPYILHEIIVFHFTLNKLCCWNGIINYTQNQLRTCFSGRHILCEVWMRIEFWLCNRHNHPFT
jgi:hypothetical protein